MVVGLAFQYCINWRLECANFTICQEFTNLKMNHEQFKFLHTSLSIDPAARKDLNEKCRVNLPSTSGSENS